MKFYRFGDFYPYTATIYAENEEQAIKTYQEQVSDLDDEDLKLTPDVVDIDAIAKEVNDNALNAILPDEEDAKIHGVGNWLFDILISNEPCVIFVDSALY